MLSSNMLPRTPILSLLRSAAKPVTVPAPARYFSTSPALKNAGSTLPAKKPVGAFRGGVLGFLAGSVTAGTLVYFYILQEYRTANEMLSEDIYALQLATQQLQSYVVELETKVDGLQKKK
jgi:hypothetical protein